MSKDLYAVLGVHHTATPEEIRSAYRRLAQKYHPDMGAPSAERFVAISDAYAILSDPHRRHAYDGERAERLRRNPRPTVEPLTHASSPAAGRRGVDSVNPIPRDPNRDPLGLLDDLLTDAAPDFFDQPPRPRERSELQLELILDRREAESGGHFPLHVPLRHCAACNGTGFRGLHRCPQCRGVRVDYHAIEISVPAGVNHGQRVRLPLDKTGLPGVDLIVTISVQR